MAEAVVIVDPKFTVTSFNLAAERLTGWGRAEALGRPCREVLRCANHRAGDNCPLAPVLRRTTNVEPHESTLHNRRNEPVRVTRAARALRNGEGGLSGIIHTFRAVPLSTEPHPLEASQRRVIIDVLRRCHGSRAAACAELGLSRTTLWRKMRRLGIESPNGEP